MNSDSFQITIRKQYFFVALPAIYLFIAMYFGRITEPFWDHTELITWITAWHDGTFEWSSLWSPHNHTRPFVYRFVMLSNAIFTQWDVDSEYKFLYLVIFGTFAVHVFAARRLASSNFLGSNLVVAMLGIISIVIFSPVGHNNHWWSMMFQLDATHFFITSAFLVVFLAPNRILSHIIATIACISAVFTLTNGIFAIVAIIITLLLTALQFPLKMSNLLQLFRPKMMTLYWLSILAITLSVYLPGISLGSSEKHPTIFELVHFAFSYLGTPLSGLLWFPYNNQFDIPLSTTFSAICGVLLVITFILLVWHGRKNLSAMKPEILILVGFGVFALISAILTGWGRAAFDSYGVANGNASRYSVFGSYLIIGQLYYVFVTFGARLSNNPNLRKSVSKIYIVFVVLAAITFLRAASIYVDAFHFNIKLKEAFTWGLVPTKYDKFIHPNQDFVKTIKSNLQRLEIGPYRDQIYSISSVTFGDYVKAAVTSKTDMIVQQFTATRDGLKAVTVRMVTPNGPMHSGRIHWELIERGTTKTLGKGSAPLSGIKDWQYLKMKLPYFSNSKGKRYELKIYSDLSSATSAGVPLYEQPGNSIERIKIITDTDTRSEPLVLNFVVHYVG